MVRCLSPRPSHRHQWILRQVVRTLEDWAAPHERQVTVGMAPLDVRFAPGRILQPDAFVLFARVAPEHVGPISEVPALCVEVMSSNRAYDRMTKRLIYAEAGVAELWTIGTDGAVERWYGDRLSDCEVPAQYLTSALLPGFQLAIAQPHIYRGLSSRSRSRREPGTIRMGVNAPPAGLTA